MDSTKTGNITSSQEKILESTFRRTAASQCKHEPEIYLQDRELLIKTLQLPFNMKITVRERHHCHSKLVICHGQEPPSFTSRGLGRLLHLQAEGAGQY